MLYGPDNRPLKPTQDKPPETAAGRWVWNNGTCQYERYVNGVCVETVTKSLLLAKVKLDA